MRGVIAGGAALAIGAVLVSTALAQSILVVRGVTSSGGVAPATAGSLALTGSLSQPIVGPTGAGSVALTGGWVPTIPPPVQVNFVPVAAKGTASY